MDVFASPDISTSCIAKRLDAIFAVVNHSEFNSDEAMDAFERKEYARVVEMTLPHAIAGNSGAQTQLSLLYQLGLGVKRDVLEAERWLLKATERNRTIQSRGTISERSMPHSYPSYGITGTMRWNAIRGRRNLD
jgi:hypothetical protein